jgi:hypothetical protein
MTESIQKNLNLFISTAIMLFFLEDVVADFLSSKDHGIHFYLELAFVIGLLFMMTTQIRKIYTIQGKLNPTQ